MRVTQISLWGNAALWVSSHHWWCLVNAHGPELENPGHAELTTLEILTVGTDKKLGVCCLFD